MPRKRKAVPCPPCKPEHNRFQHLLDSFIVSRPIPQSLRDSFPDVKLNGRYHPGLTQFHPTKKLNNDSTFASNGTLIAFAANPTEKDSRFGIGKIQYNNGTIEHRRVFVKTIHLLDPFDFLEGNYGDIDTATATSSLPSRTKRPDTDNDDLADRWEKLDSMYNRAYVDATAMAVLGRLKEDDLLIHSLQSYGMAIGIQDSYWYDITDDFDSLRAHRWFWDVIGEHTDKIKLVSDTQIDDSLRAHLLTVPTWFEDEDGQTCSSVHTGDELDDNESKVEEDTSDDEGFDELPPLETSTTDSLDESAPSSPWAIESSISFSLNDLETTSITSDSDAPVLNLKHKSGDEESSSSGGMKIRILVECKSMPVLLLFQEAADGTMDDLLEEEMEYMDALLGPEGSESSGDESLKMSNSLMGIIQLTGQERDGRWAAWLAQVIAALTQMQALLGFCHNDLHTNNIVWTKTQDEFMYYKNSDGDHFKVPTYGKIFHIIDFGRATFTVGKKSFLSDDFFVGNDAYGQYNYDACYDPERPAVMPNKSFDLCRLAVSMLDAIYDETPVANSRGEILNTEGRWKKYETTSELYNRMWEWMLDDNGKNVLRTNDGEDRFPGFELYTHIASYIHNAVPRAQWMKLPFSNYKIDYVPSGKIYDLYV
jgi:hypothetical protein